VSQSEPVGEGLVVVQGNKNENNRQANESQFDTLERDSGKAVPALHNTPASLSFILPMTGHF
jgi:hypothetical protein